jgi:hypothetical protein
MESDYCGSGQLGDLERCSASRVWRNTFDIIDGSFDSVTAQCISDLGAFSRPVSVLRQVLERTSTARSEVFAYQRGLRTFLDA